MANVRYFHLAYYGYEQTVIDSQLVAPARRLAAEGISVHPVFLESPASWAGGAWKEKRASLAAQGIPSTFLPRAPRNVLGLNTRLLARFLRESLAAGRVVLHARGLQGAHSALPVRRAHPNLRLICDVRGIESAEYELDIRYRKGRAPGPAEAWWGKSLRRIEGEAIRGSDAVLCVSRSMIPALSRRAGVPADRFDYVPCAVQREAFAAAARGRDDTRDRLGLSGKLVFVYAGSLSAWQIPERMAAVAGRALSLNPDAVFLAVTPEPDRLEKIAGATGLPMERVHCLRARHDEVPAYLAAGDVGLLLREENEVNRYSCPTKFAEYLAAGLHVLATRAINEVNETVEATGAGTLLPSLTPSPELDAALAECAARARDTERAERSMKAAERFDWSRHLPTLKKWYLQLASGTLP